MKTHKLQMPTDEQIQDQIDDFEALADMHADASYQECADRLKRRDPIALRALAESLAESARKARQSKPKR